MSSTQDARPSNRLIHEKSPYLLQHAHNPVDWYPWGGEALSRARSEDKPILLSIGYSTCHWCHVMERESFENPAVAALLNRAFVCVKLDREERPDLDALYMAAVQAMTGRGGWPLNVWLTPDLKPFFGGTYFPPVDTPGRGIGLATLADRIEKAWKEQRPQLKAQSDQMAGMLRQWLDEGEAATQAPGAEVLEAALASAQAAFDPQWGGFSPEPKFPRAMLVSLLWRLGLKRPAARDMAAHTLRGMARGGIHDQLGGGFARYSTDREWLAPHFEKMLYDNALLALAFLEGFQVTGEAYFLEVTEGVLEYVARDLSHPEGGFYSAEDADSEGQEGLFYLWTPGEIRDLLGPGEGAEFCRLFGVEEGGNFEGGRSILHLPHGRWEADRDARVKAWKARLLQARGGRARPSLDDKVITGWNGLMISAFARAGQALGRTAYLDRAAQAADFILSRCQGPAGLFRRWRGGEARFDATCEDYAFFVSGLLDLAEARGGARWLKEAKRLTEEMLAKFSDPAGGPLYFAQAGRDDLLARPKDGEDNAMPSGNSLAAMNLLRLAALMEIPRYRRKAEDILGGFAGKMKRYPLAFPQMLVALDFLLSGPRELVVISPSGGTGGELARAARSAFLPHKVLLAAPDRGPDRAELEALSPLLEGRGLKEGGEAAYVCRQGACGLPATEVKGMLAELEA